jgi:pimeloyl-ACP methyl ester carboxylesterase
MPVAAGLYYFAHNPGEHNCPPVILIHGAGGTHLSWPAEIRRLQGQRMLAVDLPGHGKSPGLGKHSIPEYTQSLLKRYLLDIPWVVVLPWTLP